MRQLFPYSGSSRKIAPLVTSIIRRESFLTYSEPMVGSGAIFFKLSPPKAFLGDIEPLITNLYDVIKNSPIKLIETIRILQPERELFEEFQEKVVSIENPITRAAVWYFLLVLCYNGVVKYKDGKPYLTWGDRYLTWHQRLKSRESAILAASQVLSGATIVTGPYFATPRANMAFFDPPWFNSAEDYGVDFDHGELSNYLYEYSSKWLLTINDCEEARNAYLPVSHWHMEIAPHYSVAPVAHGRGKRQELLLANFKPRLFFG